MELTTRQSTGFEFLFNHHRRHEFRRLFARCAKTFDFAKESQNKERLKV
jgi:hypothetical protein